LCRDDDLYDFVDRCFSDGDCFVAAFLAMKIKDGILSLKLDRLTVGRPGAQNGLRRRDSARKARPIDHTLLGALSQCG
jgi:hypothetical protein